MISQRGQFAKKGAHYDRRKDPEINAQAIRSANGRYLCGRPKAGGVTRLCERCGKESIYPYPSAGKRFCSRKCSNQWKWDHLYAKGKYMPCAHCGKMVWTPKRFIERPKEYMKEGRFCSCTCFYNSRKGRIPKGFKPFPKNHKPWNSGKRMSPEFRERCRILTSQRWKDLSFREKQLARDFTKIGQIGSKALQKYRKSYFNAHGFYPGRESAQVVRRKFLRKLGVRLDESR